MQRAILCHLEQIECFSRDFLNESFEGAILIDTRLGQSLLIDKTNPGRVFPDRRWSVMLVFIECRSKETSFDEHLQNFQPLKNVSLSLFHSRCSSQRRTSLKVRMCGIYSRRYKAHESSRSRSERNGEEDFTSLNSIISSCHSHWSIHRYRLGHCESVANAFLALRSWSRINSWYNVLCNWFVSSFNLTTLDRSNSKCIIR